MFIKKEKKNNLQIWHPLWWIMRLTQLLKMAFHTLQKLMIIWNLKKKNIWKSAFQND